MPVADKRYNTQRWRRVRRLVLQRDLYRCWIAGCPRLANQCDHIIAVEPGFPDSLFFGMHNLRASQGRMPGAGYLTARVYAPDRKGG